MTTIIITRNPDDSWTLTADIGEIVLEKVALRDVLKTICQLDAASKAIRHQR